MILYKLEDSLLQHLIDLYGEEEQLLQASGECGELIAVIQNYLRAKKFGHRTETLPDVMEEAVDVFFMIQQIRHLDPATFDYLCSQKEIKIIHKVQRATLKGKQSTTELQRG